MTTSTIGRLITDAEYEADDFQQDDRLVIFNDNPGRGRYYLSLLTYEDEDEPGKIIGHRFGAMEFDGSNSDEDCFEDVEEALYHLPRNYHPRAEKLAAGFMAQVYPQLLAGSINLHEGQRLSDKLED